MAVFRSSLSAWIPCTNTSSQSQIFTKEYKKEDEQKVRNCILSKGKVCDLLLVMDPSRISPFFACFSLLLYSCLIDLLIAQCLWAAARRACIFRACPQITREKFEIAANQSTVRLTVFTIIRHQNGAFQKRCTNWRSLKTPAFMLWLLISMLTSDYLISTTG